MSTVAAKDLGYLGIHEFVERIGFTLATLEKLEKFNGHLLNWYDTRSLEPLNPRYVSTVDSGNLAGHLIAIKNALSTAAKEPILGVKTIDGLMDTLEMLRFESRHLDVAHRRTSALTMSDLSDEIAKCFELAKGDAPVGQSGWLAFAAEMARRSETIADVVAALSLEAGSQPFDELRFWSAQLLRQSRSIHRDMTTFFPWQINELSGIDTVPDQPAGAGRPVTDLFEEFPSIAELPELYEAISLRFTENDAEHIRPILQGIKEAVRAVRKLTAVLDSLSATCAQMVDEMDFSFLLDKERKVFSIGYNIDNERLDDSFYDLLASEARLASFVAIAKGDAPQEHWFRLGRSLTPVGSSRALISWTATMFEYLMPLLVMRNYEGTLLDQTYLAVVRRQIEYGSKQRVPWGVSESAYNARDLQFNYQYEAFGVPGLGLKRGLSEDLVIAPYATALAALVLPSQAVANFNALTNEGAMSKYGFYEAIDYTTERLPPGQKHAVIMAFMAHHQGMILTALTQVLNKNIDQQRFHSEPMVQANELMLQERIPKGVAAYHPRAEEVLSGRMVRSIAGRITRVFDTPDLPTPRTQLLSNGRYSVMATSSGAGYSKCDALAVTRWREDPVRDNWGTFIYLRDTKSGAVWSAGSQPIDKQPDQYEASFSEDKIVIRRRDHNIATLTEIIVSPEDDAEARRVSITNQTTSAVEIEVTSYAEVVLTPPAADAAHPAFSNLFIQTEFLAGKDSLIARRRPRGENDERVWAIHTISTTGSTIGATQYETDRSRFLGRGHDAGAPAAIMEARPLSNSTGSVLDPVFSLRKALRIEPHETAEVCFTTAVAFEYEEAMRLADKYHGPNIFEREAALAWTKSQVEMRHLGIEPEEAYLFQRLASRILYSDPSLRPAPKVLALNTGRQSDLWVHGISGDTPIVLVRINSPDGLATVRQLVKAHEYLRMKGLVFDLVILNENPPSYMEPLQDEILSIIRSGGAGAFLDKNGGVFVKRSDQISEPDRILMHTVARAVIVTERGGIEDLLLRRPIDPVLPSDFEAASPPRDYPEPAKPMPELTHFNGLGGFSTDGQEYVTILGEGQWTPAPWLNVIANDHEFGFQVSETGSGFTWSRNSRENRLTPWSNDAVSDPPGEIVYIRDEDSGTIWSPTPLPIREAEPYQIKHGQGYTVFEHISHGIAQSLLSFVPMDAPVKLSVLNLENHTDRRRRFSVYYYCELVLGTDRERTAPYVVTEGDLGKGTIFAHNPYNNEFADGVVFVSASAEVKALTCDRKMFLGRNGKKGRPRALGRKVLYQRTGAGLDPCAAMQITVELGPGESTEMVLMLGEAMSRDEAAAITERFRDLSETKRSFDDVIKHWDDTLGTITVKTPDPALDLMVNRWLLYQTLSCRVWARSAFYQSGGAFGFRDQLQDIMALVYSKPDAARAQIVRAASRQFTEGDVQHWWHPPTGRGVRTRISDDLLWLPFVASFYVRVTGDHLADGRGRPVSKCRPAGTGPARGIYQARSL